MKLRTAVRTIFWSATFVGAFLLFNAIVVMLSNLTGINLGCDPAAPIHVCQ